MVGHYDLPAGGGPSDDGGLYGGGWEHTLLYCSEKSEGSEDFPQPLDTAQHI